jgi:hypothetical protein
LFTCDKKKDDLRRKEWQDLQKLQKAEKFTKRQKNLLKKQREWGSVLARFANRFPIPANAVLRIAMLGALGLLTDGEESEKRQE